MEKHPRLAAFDGAFLVHVGQCDAELVVWRFAGALQFFGNRACGYSASASDGFPNASSAPGGDQRYGSFQEAAGESLPRRIFATACEARALAGFVRFSLSDLPADSWRRSVHVSNRARIGGSMRIAPDRTAGPAATARSSSRAGRVVRD